MFKAIQLSLLSVFLLGACSLTGNSVDCVAKPKLAIGKCFAFAGRSPIFAARKAEILYDLEQDISRRLKGEYESRAQTEGQIGAKIDVALNARSVKRKLTRDMHLNVGSVRNMGLRDINMDQSNKRTPDELNVVVEDVAYGDSPSPVFKVRVANKVCAGAELWITAKTLKASGRLVSFSH